MGVGDGLTTCRAVDADGRGRSAVGDIDVAVGVAALSRIVVGARSGADLAALGEVAGDDESVARLDAVLPVERPGPSLPEWF